MSKRKVSNPLALAVLAQLEERPMHPYEMASTMRERGQEHSIKLNFRSLYTVVESLQRADYITAQETVREGRRPERTVYEITGAGRVELYDWLCELLGEPAKEYPRFMAGLSLMGALPPGVPDRGRVRTGHARGRAALAPRAAARDQGRHPRRHRAVGAVPPREGGRTGASTRNHAARGERDASTMKRHDPQRVLPHTARGRDPQISGPRSEPDTQGAAPRA